MLEGWIRKILCTILQLKRRIQNTDVHKIQTQDALDRNVSNSDKSSDAGSEKCYAQFFNSKEEYKIQMYTKYKHKVPWPEFCHNWRNHPMLLTTGEGIRKIQLFSKCSRFLNLFYSDLGFGWVGGRVLC